MRTRPTLERLLRCLAAAAAATIAGSLGCHGSRGDVATLDAGAITATAKEAARSSEDEYWAHTKQVFDVPVGHSPALGPADALVTIVEFSDLDGAAGGAMDAILRALRDEYGDKLRLVWKSAGADDVRKALTGRAHDAAIVADLELAEDLEVEGTPTFFINGRRLEGVQPRAKLERMIDEEIRRAEGLLATGTPKAALYQALVGSGAGRWRPQSKSVPALPPSDPTLGGASANVTVHVFSDYQCALCVAVERAMSDLQKAHGDRIRFVWHDLPLARHRVARLVAQATREAFAQKGARGFWAMHEKIFYAPTEPAMSDLDALARGQSLDMGRWRAAMDGGAHAAEIEADERGASDAGIKETPAFLVVAKGASQGSFVGNIDYASKLGRVVERALDGD